MFRDAGTAVDLETAHGLVFMGGPMSANDDLAYIRRELALIERAAAAGKPILGVCLGAQLVAKALGARVHKNPVKEIGWYPVRWAEAASRDALLSGMGRPSISPPAPSCSPVHRPAGTRRSAGESRSTAFSSISR